MQEDLQNENIGEIKNEGENIPPKTSLDKNQKIAMAVLTVFAFFIVIMWMVQFKRGLTEPFAYKGGDEVETRLSASLQADSDEALKAKDTDGDDLSDWDELNLYKTSPYLEDSDSDGFTDKQEVESGKDPNCPAGRDCSGAPIGAGNEATSLGENSNNLQDLINQFNSNLNTSEPSSGGTNDLLQGSIDAATLRQLLLQSGMDKNALDQISDEELVKSYSEMLKGQ